MRNTEKTDTILFDLDGTLLPLNQDAFTEAYFRLLSKRAAAMGYEPEPFLKALWSGTGAMVRNDGGASNCQRFWDIFSSKLGPEVRTMEAELEDFYATDFYGVRSVLGPIPSLSPLLEKLRDRGFGLVLATNPLFPPVAVESRLDWIGLTPSVFDYITTYENSRYCKPNPGYFQDILNRLDKRPGQCLMVGNNPVDDMSARELGLRVFLLTDYLENPEQADFSAYPHGGFADMEAFLLEL